jgi:hypothetical protein
MIFCLLLGFVEIGLKDVYIQAEHHAPALVAHRRMVIEAGDPPVFCQALSALILI